MTTKKELKARIDELEKELREARAERDAECVLKWKNQNKLLSAKLENNNMQKYCYELESKIGNLVGIGNLFVAKIVHNKEKGATTIWFKDGTRKIVKKRDGVKDCVYTAVAFAIVEKLYGSNSAFQNSVEDVLTLVSKGRK